VLAGLAVDIPELRVPVRVPAPLGGLDVALQAEVLLAQQSLPEGEIVRRQTQSPSPITNTLSWLRRKLGTPSLIETRPGVGYRITDAAKTPR